MSPCRDHPSWSVAQPKLACSRAAGRPSNLGDAIPRAVGAFVGRRAPSALVRQMYYPQYVTPAKAFELGIPEGPYLVMEPGTHLKLMVNNVHSMFSQHIHHYHIGVSNRDDPSLRGITYMLFLDDRWLNPDRAPLVVLPGQYIVDSDILDCDSDSTTPLRLRRLDASLVACMACVRSRRESIWRWTESV